MDATVRAPSSFPGLTFKPHQSCLMSALDRCSFRPITRYSKCHSWRVEYPTYGGSLRINASSEFPKRRKKKESSLTAAGNCPMAFIPNSVVETGSQREDKQINGDEESNLASTTGIDESALDTGVDCNGKHAAIITNGLSIEESFCGETNCELVDVSQASTGDRNHASLNGDVLVMHDGGDKSQSLESSINNQDNFLAMDDDHVSLEASDDIKCLAALGEGPKSVAALSYNGISPVRMGGHEKSLLRLDVTNKSLPAPNDDKRSLVPLGDEEGNLIAPGHNQTSVVVLTDEEQTLVVSGNDDQDKHMVAVGDEQRNVVLPGHDQTSLIISKHEDNLLASGKDEKCVVAFNGVQKSLVALGEDNKSLDVLGESTVGSALVQSRLEEEDVDFTDPQLGDVEGAITESKEQIQTCDDKIESELLKQELLKISRDIADKVDEDNSSHKLTVEKEAQMRRQVIEKLAEENFSTHNKLFTYPQAVKPGEDIELFLNRSLSTLMNEPSVLITGAFNDWRWKSFTINLEKSQLHGDWWSCKIHVPKEAYKIDFVFFNVTNIYDNNNRKDFHITIEGGMDAVSFEDLLLEEKKRELEQLAKEQAEKEMLTEEQKQLEEERAATEVTRAQAKVEAERGRLQLQDLIKKAKTSVENLWYLELCESGSEKMVQLYYNRSSGPLAHANEIWIHGGVNNWRDGLSVSTKLIKSENTDADWWYAEVDMPDQAFILDWVFADGPPQKAIVYDNNNRQDFHAIVPKSTPEELYWSEEEQRIFCKLQEERRAREEAICVKEKKTAEMRAKTKERALNRFLISQKHIVYTDPLEVRAGETVTVYYNPASTVLNGRPEVWFRCSFNRWTHREGPLAPQKMVPSDTGSCTKTTVKVPLDAYMMDFVFSEKETGGIFDNKDDMDYHLPVYGGIVKEPPIHIVHIAIEMAPIAKVGGLGDVVTSLSRAVQDLNHHVDVILPKYNCLNLSNVKDLVYQRSFPWGGTEIKVWVGKVEGLSVYFLEPCNGFFSSGCIYGCRNDAERFSFFCHAALEFLKQSGSQPDIVHCHDWSSAPVAWLFKEHYQNNGFSKTRVVFTIHNLEFGAHFIGKAMHYSDKATTVSHSYSKEVAANPAIASNIHKFHGIVNGIDPDIWDPYNDKLIPVPYTSENVVEGKRAAKDALQRRLGLKVADIPLIGVISRLTHQKGIHLIKHAIWRTLDQNGQFILLGSAPDSRIQLDFVDLANQLHSAHNDRARLFLKYDEPLSHLIYSAADIILVPSMFEPCGLTQLVAMRYGAIPVVRKTGGLYDTVFDVDHDKERAQVHGLEPNGFSFEGTDANGLDYALNRAISAWYSNRDWFYSLSKRVMEQDWSWNRPALDYLELYHAAKKY